MKHYRLRLHHYILLVAFLSFVLAIASTTWSSYLINTHTLKENTLETNRVYAQKLAQTTDTYLNTTLQDLSYSAKEISGFMDDEMKIQREVDSIGNQLNTFNSILVTNAEGKILATVPEKLNVKNQILNTEGGKQALSEKRTIISKPYVSLTKRNVIFISTPIFDENRNYVGLIGGSIYLEEINVLYELLGKHFYEDGSYVYVVDPSGRIIYHQDGKRILEDVSENEVVKKVLKGESGARQLVNTQNVDMLAGYASIPAANWGIISQRETGVSILPAKSMLKSMFYISLPLLLLSLVILFFISKKIARPLNQLAYYAEISTHKNHEADLSGINTFYYEAIELKKSLLKSFAYLHNQMNHFIHQSTTDLLTGLQNRRAFEETTLQLMEKRIPFSIVLMDIDNFKKVNDTFGHNIGDLVLQFLAEFMVESISANGICYRYGGEEFVIILPETEAFDAWVITNHLRRVLSEQVSPTGDCITISAGISAYPEDGITIANLTSEADKRLYQAKDEGKNKVIAGA